MAELDPFAQNITLFLPDDSNVTVSLTDIDAFHAESVSTTISYGAQLGACLIMLVTILVMTPSAKFRRSSNILHVVALFLSSVRMTLLCAFFPSPFNDFYAYWAGDYSRVPRRDYIVSVIANTFTLLVVMAIEAALMNQAWTMVTLWPRFWKYTISVASACVTFLTIGSRIAFTVVQSEAVLSVTNTDAYQWVLEWAVINNAVSIAWFCFLFNAKLVMHLISNRGLLPSYKGFSPMEVLIMTNGVLMIFPVIFSGLEFGNFINFESASLTLTSVVIILPLGTLAAQRIAQTAGSSAHSDASSGRFGDGVDSSNSRTPLKTTTYSNGSCGVSAPQVFVSSRCEGSMSSRDRLHPADVELGRVHIDYELANGQVRVERNLEQHEERM